MADTQTSTTPPSASAGLPALLTRHRQPVAYGLFVLAVAFAGLAVWLFVLAGDEGRRWAYIWTGVWLMLLSFLSAGAGLFQMLY
ncbi:MAG TPA: hypothetical protein VFA18_22845, partial [Gemmataceae bacterium]|nr:hypothetical protein [Gemmataceae bacterium]